MALCAGSTSFYLVRKGILRPNKYLGAAPKVFMSSFLAYWAGKISYIQNDRCKDKFLKDAPDSEMAYYIRKERGLQQPWTAIRDFGGKDLKKEEDEDNVFRINISIPSVPSILRPLSDDGDKLVISDKEQEILDECDDRSNKISILLSILFGTLMFGAQKKGFITKVRETNSKWIKKLPVFPFRNRTIHGILFGFVLGQILYVLSDDFEESILEHAPDGELAKLIRKQSEKIEVINDFKNANEQDIIDHGSLQIKTNEMNGKLNTTLKKKRRSAKLSEDEYSDINKIDPYTHATYLTDNPDLRSVDWFGKPDIDLNEIRESLKQKKQHD